MLAAINSELLAFSSAVLKCKNVDIQKHNFACSFVSVKLGLCFKGITQTEGD
jgi:hypothetical protein